jgi:hypothetical protein
MDQYGGFDFKENIVFEDIDISEYLRLDEEQEDPSIVLVSVEPINLEQPYKEKIACELLIEDSVDKYIPSLNSNSIDNFSTKASSYQEDTLSVVQSEYLGNNSTPEDRVTRIRKEYINRVQQLLEEVKNRCKSAGIQDLYPQLEEESELVTDNINTISEQLLSKLVIDADKNNRIRKARNVHLPSESKSILYNWFLTHVQYPYPTKQQKVELATQTYLSEKQVETWFTNMRLRHWKPLLEQNKNL